MINYNLIKINRLKILVVILVISLFGNFYLVTELNNYENRTEHVRENQYLSYFSALMHYSNSLNYLASSEAKDYDTIERELQALYAHSFNLVEHARAYGLLSNKEDDELSDLIWNLAVHIQNITNNLDKAGIENNENFKKFSRIINEVVKLENETRMEMLQQNRRFIGYEMYILLSPKVDKVISLYLLDE